MMKYHILEGATSKQKAIGRPRLQYLKQVARHKGADSYTAMKIMACNNWRRRRRRRRGGRGGRRKGGRRWWWLILSILLLLFTLHVWPLHSCKLTLCYFLCCLASWFYEEPLWQV